MVKLILNGVLLGLLLSILIGPVFLLLIETSIKKGFKTAFIMDIGMILSDILIIVVVYFGASDILKGVVENKYLGLAGGGLFVGFGISGFFNGNKKKQEIVSFSKSNYSRYLFKGFLLNTINPSVLIFWLATVTFVIAQYHVNRNNVPSFFLCTIITIFTIDILKILAAVKIKKYMSLKFITTTGKVTSLILTAFGVFLLFKYFSF